jgi:hypothetical protein
MKTYLKTFTSVLAALFILTAISQSVYAQSDKKYNKEMEKVYQKKTKELKKQGWSVSGTSLTLEAAMMKHLRTVTSDEKSKELITEVSMCKSENVCKANALNNALIEYANNAGSYVRGRVTSDMFNNASASVPEEFDKFYAAYERLVQAEMKGELEFSFAIEKSNGDGKTYRAYYIVNEDKAGKARIRAMQRAAEETKIAQQYAEQVSNFVREGFND